jgi:hypothetical protein
MVGIYCHKDVMTMRKMICLVMLLGAFFATGCGSSSTSTETATKQADGATPAVAAVGEPKVVQPMAGNEAGAAPVAANVMPPAEVVALFFDSMRRGDEVQTSALLTTKAREELAKSELVIQPPGSPAATYQIGRTSFLDNAKDAAYVESILNEPTGNGTETKPWEIVWAVRLESDGWRIAGFAVEISESESPVVVDFENGADTKAKVEGVQQVPTQTATAPAQPAAQGDVRR